MPMQRFCNVGGNGRQGRAVMLGLRKPLREQGDPDMSEPRDTVVVKDGGSSTGVILGIIAIIIVLALGWYFLMGPGGGSRTNSSNDTNINVTLPSVPAPS
jgi:hypothetical protein